MSYIISRAHLNDTIEIMQFMDDVWRKGHILSYHKELFLYEFQDGEKLNFIITKNDENKIVGLFGFIPYNYSNNPDIAGSLWKVDPKVKAPLLGMQMREYFKKNITHDFFAAPGAGLQTKSIYQVLKMNWNRMEHYYIANSVIEEFKICKNPQLQNINPIQDKSIKFEKVTDKTILDNFRFMGEEIVPRKDKQYFKKRFVNYPIYKYDIYSLSNDGVIKNLIVCREVEAEGHYAYRIVDFYGSELFMREIASFFYRLILEKKYEYIDFVSFGFDQNHLLDAGFTLLDFYNTQTTIPNFFEPFVQQNIPVYCVSDKSKKRFRQCKADGDQDRPNFVR